MVDAGTGAESPRERNFYRWQVYGLRMETERIARTGVFFFHRVVNQYLLARKYLATGHETDANPTRGGRSQVESGSDDCRTGIQAGDAKELVPRERAPWRT
ncbi:hypothetical protein QCE42_06880 [Caballeronia sp. LZ050]|uniref:hypothetical protein n=1 Tax=Caballeronia sp. LZ050 TaxID=3038570 RepID=UPI00285BB64D|nr:hypothetical protein [Caballeronia sp. LZ050]MDR5854591.1 hypothetical protein [Caballeronia sp. LZ050]